MSDEAKAPKKKGGKGRLILLVLAAFLLGGAGVVGVLYGMGMFNSAPAGPVEDPNRPKLVPKGEDPVAIADKARADAGVKGEGNSHIPTDVHVPKEGVDLLRPKDVSGYQATYFQMPAPYTSNLSDSDALVQIALAVSTYYDARVTEAVKTHEMAIRSAILMMLAQEQEMTLTTPEGKQALQKKLTNLINKILKEKTGYSGIDNVYFTNFVIQ
ncbi:MAG: flagellar basal body-associated FliL family protein [Sphingobium sp.]|nr:flagellar basal body-associated FliL family protein [Sphingobium sp.]